MGKFVKYVAGGAMFSALTVGATSAFADDKFDIAMQAVVASDNYSYGVTNTDHNPWGQISITPSYGIFYGTASIENLKYTNVTVPDQALNSRIKLTAGITPSFGDLSFDISVQRDWRAPSSTGGRYRTVPYAIATYKFNDMFSLLGGGGYYAYDSNVNSPNTAELYAGVKFKPVDMISFSGDLYYDNAGTYTTVGVGPTQNYLEAIGNVKVNIVSGLSVSGTLGSENYEVVPNGVPNYLWYDVGADYAFNDHISVGAHYIGNNLGTGSAACAAQSYNFDCDSRFVASLTINGKLSDLKRH